MRLATSPSVLATVVAQSLGAVELVGGELVGVELAAALLGGRDAPAALRLAVAEPQPARSPRAVKNASAHRPPLGGRGVDRPLGGALTR
jgi:hypothetical protein